VVTGPRLYQLRAVSVTGRTTPYIAVAHLIRTGLRQIGLEAALAVIHSPNVRPVPGNRFLDRVESSRAGLPRVVVLATLAGMQVPATVQQALAAQIAPAAPVVVRPEPIASAAVIFRAAVQATGMRSEVVPGDSMDPTHAATAIVASPAWDLAVAASIVAASAMAAEAFVVVASVAVVEASEVVEAAGVAAAGVAGKRCES
jgi:hypothetical protein